MNWIPTNGKDSAYPPERKQIVVKLPDGNMTTYQYTGSDISKICLREQYVSWLDDQEDEWIAVTSGVLPNVLDDVGFIIKSKDKFYDGRRMGGRYMGLQFGYHEFSVPGHSWEGSHWCKLPALPSTPQWGDNKIK